MILFLNLALLFLFYYKPIQTFELNIVHMNDVHSYFYESNNQDLRCSDKDYKDSECFGGIARQVAKIKEIRSVDKNVLVLAAGDFYLADSFYPYHGWKLASILLPYLTLNATSLGNHDFDQNMFDTAAYILSLKIPVVATNLIGRNGSFWTQHIKKSVVFEVGGRKVGILGYISPETKRWAHVGKSLMFTDEIPSLQQEAEKLKASGVDIIIALGHSSHHMDQLIALSIPNIDVIVAGNSDVYFHSPPGLNFMEDISIHPYPTVIKRDNSNKTALLVQIPQHGRHLGHLKVKFDNHGDIINYTGKPILLEMKIKPDPETEAKFNETRAALLKSITWRHIPAYEDVLTNLVHHFQGHRQECRMRECTLGNMITDAMVHAYVNHNDDLRKKKVDAAVWNAGSIRTSLPSGNVTFLDLTNALYLGDKAVLYNMTGARLKKMMEDAVAKYDLSGIAPPGSFLQVSRMKVEYDLAKPPGQRVVSLKIQCARCPVPSYKPVVKKRNYNVVLPEFFLRGGDGFFEHHGNRFNVNDIIDGLAITQYLQETTPFAKIEGRITFSESSPLSGLDIKDIKSALRMQTLSEERKPIPYFDGERKSIDPVNEDKAFTGSVNTSMSTATSIKSIPGDLTTNPSDGIASTQVTDQKNATLNSSNDNISMFGEDIFLFGFGGGIDNPELDVTVIQADPKDSGSNTSVISSSTVSSYNDATVQSQTNFSNQNDSQETKTSEVQDISLSLDDIFRDDPEYSWIDTLATKRDPGVTDNSSTFTTNNSRTVHSTLQTYEPEISNPPSLSLSSARNQYESTPELSASTFVSNSDESHSDFNAKSSPFISASTKYTSEIFVTGSTTTNSDSHGINTINSSTLEPVKKPAEVNSSTPASNGISLPPIKYVSDSTEKSSDVLRGLSTSQVFEPSLAVASTDSKTEIPGFTQTVNSPDLSSIKNLVESLSVTNIAPKTAAEETSSSDFVMKNSASPLVSSELNSAAEKGSTTNDSEFSSMPISLVTTENITQETKSGYYSQAYTVPPKAINSEILNATLYANVTASKVMDPLFLNAVVGFQHFRSHRTVKKDLSSLEMVRSREVTSTSTARFDLTNGVTTSSEKGSITSNSITSSEKLFDSVSNFNTETVPRETNTANVTYLEPTTAGLMTASNFVVSTESIPNGISVSSTESVVTKSLNSTNNSSTKVESRMLSNFTLNPSSEADSTSSKESSMSPTGSIIRKSLNTSTESYSTVISSKETSMTSMESISTKPNNDSTVTSRNRTSMLSTEPITTKLVSSSLNTTEDDSSVTSPKAMSSVEPKSVNLTSNTSTDSIVTSPNEINMSSIEPVSVNSLSNISTEDNSTVASPKGTSLSSMQSVTTKSSNSILNESTKAVSTESSRKEASKSSMKPASKAKRDVHYGETKSPFWDFFKNIFGR